jgi:hypothetical protein
LAVHQLHAFARGKIDDCIGAAKWGVLDHLAGRTASRNQRQSRYRYRSQQL